MKIFSLGLLLLILKTPIAVSQSAQDIDSLKRLLMQTREDSSRVSLLNELTSNYLFFNPDSAIIITQQAIDLAQNSHFNKGQVRALNLYGEARRFKGEFPQALEIQFNALEISKSIDDKEYEALCVGSIGSVYLDLNEYRQAIQYFDQARKINKHISDSLRESRWLSSIGYCYQQMNVLDSALYFQQQAYTISNASSEPTRAGSLISTRLGMIHARLGHRDLALRFFHEAIKVSFINRDLLNTGRTQYQLAQFYHTVGQTDSSLHYCQLAFENSERISQKRTVLDASNLMVELYKSQNKLDSAFHYQEIRIATYDLLYGREKFQQLQLLILNEQQHQQQLREKQVQFERIALLSALALVILIALLLLRNIRQQQHTNKALNFKNEQIETQRNILEKTISELKSTQAQLIQSEKMASLGELTAGIAHEIQNPLNFVNNFSEVNLEMNAELKDKLKKILAEGKQKNEIDEILTSIESNEQKIIHHGKRADAIVKGMLQHSRISTGQKEATNINALVDEYLRLSYHGFRAKDEKFHATMLTNFDPTIDQINIIPQDIGRVLLNLINNAFYAVSEKKKQQDGEYKPTVTIETKKINNKVQIRIIDNGTGVPPKILEKIFQPFFTTKPTGQGTGLGLSMSFDIIKAHGGELKVESRDGGGAEFIVQIPIKLTDIVFNPL